MGKVWPDGFSKGAGMRVLGLMSGTSMDGVDAAVLETDGEAILGFGPTGFRAYDEAGLIGEGTHERFIVETASFLAKAAKKQSK